MRPAILNSLFRPLSRLAGVGPSAEKWLNRLVGDTVLDILWHLPSGVNHRPQLNDLNAVHGEFGTFSMIVSEHVSPPRRGRRTPYRVIGTGLGSIVELVFFNYHAHYLTEKLPIGQTVWVSGRVERIGGQIKVLHPDYISGDLNKIPEFEAVYPLTYGATSRAITRLIDQICPDIPHLPEWLDVAHQSAKGWPAWGSAVCLAHHPRAVDVLSLERQRLAYDELLANQLALMLTRRRAKKQNGIALSGTGDVARKLTLPFELTESQNRVIHEIRSDLASSERMIRLLQGDVGSGKTVVALMGAIQAIESGYQVAFMAPTDILARQHFATLEKWLTPLGVRVGLLTARDKGAIKKETLNSVGDGQIHLLVGTHALIEDGVTFARLGFVVIDEQHKFGVNQRLALTQKQKGVNLLVMTATPIPRTLALTAYGDMDVSVLNEKPPGRQSIETRVMGIAKIPDLIDKLKTQTRQVYWVCPLVEESEKADLTAVKDRYEALHSVLGDRVGLVHGKMKGPEKDAVMMDFANGRIQVLVATTVIEVGVDVPAATLMVIEHAERFGLSALHQLRGRVGRGEGQSVCLLLHASKLGIVAKERLKTMRETDDGFKIAEADLRLRGAGDVLGWRQSGMPEFKMADLSVHADLLYTATQDARTILTLDPDLISERGQALRLLLYLFRKDAQVATLKAG